MSDPAEQSSGTEVGHGAVARQVDAYNAHDAEAFAACYVEGVVVEVGGDLNLRGRSQLRSYYESVFAAHPSLRVEIRSRIAVGDHVVDEEYVTGHPTGAARALAIYELAPDGLIAHLRIVREASASTSHPTGGATCRG